jgi:hypothetical protein
LHRDNEQRRSGDQRLYVASAVALDDVDEEADPDPGAEQGGDERREEKDAQRLVQRVDPEDRDGVVIFPAWMIDSSV